MTLAALRRLAAAPARWAGGKLLGLARRLDGTRRSPAIEAWFHDDGDATLRQEYDLGPQSLVIDLGGYKGQWASDIHARYGCPVHVFEPVPDFARAIAARFARNPAVTVHDAALGPEDGQARIALEADSSHMVAHGGVAIRVLRADTFLDSLGAAAIDLMKINIEGAEYDLLDHLLDTGWAARIRDLQVQFHRTVPDAEARRERIRQRLRTTHETTYDYPFVWENWRLRP